MAVGDQRLGGDGDDREMQRAEIAFLREETKYQFFCLLDLFFSFLSFFTKLIFLIFPCHVIGGRKGCTSKVVHESFSFFFNKPLGHLFKSLKLKFYLKNYALNILKLKSNFVFHKIYELFLFFNT
jgi:hypothetical protein